MRKKILCSFLAGMLALSVLAGCGNSDSGSSSDTGNTSSGTTDSGTEGSADVGGENSEPDEIVFAYMTQNNMPEEAELERVENLINEYIVDKINAKVDLVLFSNADYINQVNLMLAAGEQLDLFKAEGVPNMNYIQDGTAMDITDFLDDELKETSDTIYENMIKAVTVEGKVYGLINMGSNFVPNGLHYRSDITEELGINMDEVSSYEDLTGVFTRVKEAYPNMTIIEPTNAKVFVEAYLGKVFKYDPLGEDIFYMVGGGAKQDDSTVVNVYETEDFKVMSNLAREWYKAGFYASDAATTSATLAETLTSGNCFSAFGAFGNPKLSAQYTANYGHPFDSCIISDSMIWSNSAGAWMINSASEVPEAAARFLNLLYTDEYVFNLLVYGEENVDYIINEEGYVVAPEGHTDLNTVPYTNNLNYYYWGNKWLTLPVPGSVVGDELKALIEKNYAGENSRYYGFQYDYSELEAEYTACRNIIDEYKMALYVGALDVDSTLEEMNARLYAAGMQKLIDAKQEQLDAWLAQQ